MSQQNASGVNNNTGNTGSTNVLNAFFQAGPLLLDRRVPFVLKMLPIAAAIYWVWPIDLMPGLPFDDIAVLLIALTFFVKLANDAIEKVQQAEYAQQATAGAGAAAGDASIVDTTWRVVE